MTAQVPDAVVVDGESYALVGIGGDGLFDPGDHALEPRAMHTGCWRGFVCTYAVDGDALVLDTLTLGAGSTLAGEPVAAGTAFLGGVAEAPTPGELVFRRLGLRMPFTGSLLLGADFVPETYVHMGFHAAWKYARVVQLTVDGGTVIARHDKSEDHARVRASVMSGEREDPDGPPRAPGWIARTFGRGLDRSPDA